MEDKIIYFPLTFLERSDITYEITIIIRDIFENNYQELKYLFDINVLSKYFRKDLLKGETLYHILTEMILFNNSLLSRKLRKDNPEYMKMYLDIYGYRNSVVFDLDESDYFQWKDIKEQNIKRYAVVLIRKLEPDKFTYMGHLYTWWYKDNLNCKEYSIGTITGIRKAFELSIYKDDKYKGVSNALFNYLSSNYSVDILMVQDPWGKMIKIVQNNGFIPMKVDYSCGLYRNTYGVLDLSMDTDYYIKILS